MFIVIKVNRKLLILGVLIISLGILGFSICAHINSRHKAAMYTGSDVNSVKWEKTSLTAFLSLDGVEAQQHKEVEIFDIIKGSVVKKVETNDILQGEAEKYLRGITGVYVKVKAFPDRGYIVKIPLEPSVAVDNKWLKGLVNEVYVLFPEKEMPYLLVLDDTGRPSFYNFEGNTDILLKNLGINLV